MTKTDLAADPADARLQVPADPLGGEPRPGVGLALSGGGYKAALFHLGGLTRLNELGALRRIDRISSVSGGSITSAWLALNWSKLTFDAEGRAVNFDALVRGPFDRFIASARIDVFAGLGGVLNPFSTTGQALAGAYASRLFGAATLQDLPEPGTDAPDFVFNATNMQLNSLWRFSRRRAADHRVGEILAPDFSLAQVVAASSGFPPFFSPVVFAFRPGQVRPFESADRGEGTFLERALVADGGIYDNLGLEAVWKRYRTVLVSNAGDPFDETATPPKGWLKQLRRVTGVMHRQAENHRLRWLIALARAEHRTVAAWSLRNDPGAYGAPGGLALGEADRRLAQHAPVRLWPPTPAQAQAVFRHGYAMADAAVRRYWLTEATAPSSFPPSLL